MSVYGDKKGYIRTLEAVIAIVLLLFFMFSVSSRKVEDVKQAPVNVIAAQKAINNELLNNEDLRAEILSLVNYPNPRSSKLEKLIDDSLPPNYDYDYAICKETICIKPIKVDTSIYSTDTFIFSANENVKPAIVRIWMWKRVKPIT